MLRCPIGTLRLPKDSVKVPDTERRFQRPRLSPRKMYAFGHFLWNIVRWRTFQRQAGTSSRCRRSPLLARSIQLQPWNKA
jgi:hypothetical protein